MEDVRELRKLFTGSVCEGECMEQASVSSSWRRNDVVLCSSFKSRREPASPAWPGVIPAPDHLEGLRPGNRIRDSPQPDPQSYPVFILFRKVNRNIVRRDAEEMKQ